MYFFFVLGCVCGFPNFEPLHEKQFHLNFCANLCHRIAAPHVPNANECKDKDTTYDFSCFPCISGPLTLSLALRFYRRNYCIYLKHSEGDKKHICI